MTAILFGIVFAAILGAAAAAAYRVEQRRQAADDAEPGRLEDVLPAQPVEHRGADEEWSPAGAWTTPAGDPLARDLSAIELADPLLFEEVAAAYAVRLDWQPPDFSAEWKTLGAVLAEMGETQPLPRIEAVV